MTNPFIAALLAQAAGEDEEQEQESPFQITPEKLPQEGEPKAQASPFQITPKDPSLRRKARPTLVERGAKAERVVEAGLDRRYYCAGTVGAPSRVGRDYERPRMDVNQVRRECPGHALRGGPAPAPRDLSRSSQWHGNDKGGTVQAYRPCHWHTSALGSVPTVALSSEVQRQYNRPDARRQDHEQILNGKTGGEMKN